MREEKKRADEEGFTAIFVRRPVLALVLNLLIVVAGLAALIGAEVRELPETDNPVITVRTEFSGAAPETVDRELTARIEGAAGRVPGVKSLSSSSNFGRSTVTVEFTESTDLDIAASDLRDAISRISRDLPDAAEDPVIVKADANSQAVMRLALTSDALTVQQMTLYVEEEILDRLTAVPGVADVQVYGDRDEIFRIDVDQGKLAARGLTVADLATALSSAAFDAPAGSLTSNSQDFVVRASASIASREAFEAILIKDRVRIGDVASVTLGPDPGDSSLRANGRNGVGLGILRQARSNTLDISAGVRAAVEELKKVMPETLDIRVTSDDATFISGAISEVVWSLLLAVAIVIAVIYLFLVNIRATLIPALTIPVALVGAIAGIWLAGFSVNILTLLALVLATGMVVDDAIVVLENIVTRRNEGMGARAAAVIGTRQVFFAVVTTTATLAAVFIPISFLPGKAGGLFREFGFTLAIAVMLSSVVALSLAPMLASRFLAGQPRAEAAHGGIYNGIAKASAGFYARTLAWTLNAPAIVIAISLLVSGAAVVTFGLLKQELTPQEDRSVVFFSVTAPQGVSLQHTASQIRKLEDLVQPLAYKGEVRNIFSIAGRGGQANSGFLVLTLAPWDERVRGQQAIVDDLNRLTGQVPGVRAFAMQPNSLGIRGAGNGLQMALAGEDYETLAKASDAIALALEQDPRFGRIRQSYETTQPQLSITVDREKASDLGIGIEGLAPVIQSMLDGRAIGTVFLGDRAVEVKLLSSSNPVNDPTDLENIFLKTTDGRAVPMSTISTLVERPVAPSLSREQKFRAVTVTASLSDDFPLATAIAEFERIAAPHMPPGARLVPMAEAAELGETSGNMGMVFGFAIIVVLLVLAAQFESFISAFIIILTVPLGLACAVFAMAMTGTSLNVYSQIGLVLLVGIMAKNGILIVEFANQLRDRGASVREAIEQACLRRLRPVLMTMISTVLGGVPLVLASGAGAEARIALGWVIAGGLGLATLATLYVTPVAYLLLARFVTPQATEEARLEKELKAADSLR